MKKIITFFAIAGSIGLLLSNNGLCDESLLSSAANLQSQSQFTASIPVGNGSYLNAAIQYQQQDGNGYADLNSLAGDIQNQSSITNGSTLSSYSGGITNGGDYNYINKQVALTVEAPLNIPNETHNIGIVIGGMGALTNSNGNALSVAGGSLSHDDWSMTNQSNSINKPISINVDGYVFQTD